MAYQKKTRTAGSRAATQQEPQPDTETPSEITPQIDFKALMGEVDKSMDNQNPVTGKVYTSRMEALENTHTTTVANPSTSEDIATTVLAMKPKEKPISSLTEEQVRAIAKKENRTKGRYIPNIDDAKPGVTFWQPTIDNGDLPYKVMNSTPAIDTSTGILDTGADAQTKEDIAIPEMDDPRHVNYMSCMNKSCQFREGCLRYRLHNKKSFKAIFYPEECKETGIYQSINDTDFTAYDPFNNLESKNTPSVF